MTIGQSLLFFLVSFAASIAGAICGIGGGVIIKPVLDLFGWASVSTISFLSGCTVLSMSCYSVGKSMLTGEKSVALKTGTPLAVGAAVGGIVGKELFGIVKALFENQNSVGAVPAVCLMLITIGTLVYTVFKGRIKTLRIENPLACIFIGLFLGVLSSFLGIGGGPINLVVLYFFFSMDTKTAAANSLYIILFSQITSLISTIVSRSIPPFDIKTVVFMVCGGIAGGIVGRIFNKRLNNTAVDKLFMGLMFIIILISAYNAIKYSAV